MKVVVIGALGHIGSKLIRELPRKFKNCEIVMIDNFLTQRYCSLFSLPRGPRYKFFEADVVKADLEKIVKSADVVIHLSQIADLRHEYIGQKNIEGTNYRGLTRIADLCAKYKVRLFFPSTTSVYGVNKKWVYDDGPVSDLSPQSPYAESKLVAERYLRRLGRKSNLPFTILRWGTIFGVSPGIRFNTAVSKFCMEAAFGQPLSVWRTAYNQYRPYLDIDDAVNSIIFLIKKDIFEGDIYNVATLNVRVKDVVRIIKKYLKNTKIRLVDHPIMSEYSYKVSSRKIESMGFVARGDLEDGIRGTLKLFGAVSSNQ